MCQALATPPRQPKVDIPGVLVRSTKTSLGRPSWSGGRVGGHILDYVDLILGLVWQCAQNLALLYLFRCGSYRTTCSCAVLHHVLQQSTAMSAENGVVLDVHFLLVLIYSWLLIAIANSYRYGPELYIHQAIVVGFGQLKLGLFYIAHSLGSWPSSSNRR